MSQAAEKHEGLPPLLKGAAFQWQDPLGLESELTEDERMVRDTAHGFAPDYLMPRVGEAYREGKYDPHREAQKGQPGPDGPNRAEHQGGAGRGRSGRHRPVRGG